jgi:NAD(P)-dependent dehydrogenase (short-subunit alcohol dehydrogenase family)
MEIQGRTAIVTGGGTGIGAAIASDLSANGARVLIAGRRRTELAATAARMQQGGEASYRVTDVSVPSECTALVEEAERRFGAVDILVNNAGIKCHGRLIEEHTVEDWDRVMATNLRAAYLLTAGVLPGMKRRRRGFILMVSSDSGIHYFRNQSIYGLSKHGMNALVQFILAEAGQDNVHAAALCPGLTDTDMGLSFDPPIRANVLSAQAVAAWARWIISQPENMNVARPLVLSPMRDPWEAAVLRAPRSSHETS